MVRFLAIWRVNPVAPWPRDPAESLKLMENAWAGLDDLIKKGEVKEFGWFEDGTSGYIICEMDPTAAFKGVITFRPYWDFEVHVVTPYEKGREIFRALCKAQIAAAKK